jgi:DNA-binding NtrC family response regulator
VVDRKQHIRTFLCDVLEELGFLTRECAQLGEINTALNAQHVDLIVLGLSSGGAECGKMLQTLADRKFGGKVILLGYRASLMLGAVQEFGEKLGLAMLPVLPTPFGSEHLRGSVATLLPIEPPPVPRWISAKRFPQDGSNCGTSQRLTRARLP